MYIRDIELTAFRNYVYLKAAFNEKVNIFVGNNAQGKTNLLEGIYLNAMARSFRPVKDRDMIMFDEELCRIKTSAVLDGEDEETEIVINRDGRKVIKIDGVKADRTSQLLDRIFMIVFSPEDLKIVKDEPEKRRRFMDRELCLISPGYYSDLSGYRKVLKQRNTYLKETVVRDDVLEIWDMELAKYGSRLISKRNDFIKKTDAVSRDIHSRLSGGAEELSLQYEASIDDVGEEEFLEIIRSRRSEDRRSRNTGLGPHKDDIRICASGMDLRKFGSQGQQRTAALSLKLSEIRIIEEEKKERPILLLDDVLSELDRDRQRYLLTSLGENQMFITTADLSENVVKDIGNPSIFTINGGKIEKTT